MPRRDTARSFHGLVPLDDAWDLVIKVKYAGTLKRFNAFVNGLNFDHNLAALRSKVLHAFKFSPDAEFTLTYTDEDGDAVMLDDDDDLRDAAINQKLNPLRIDVQLKSGSAGAPRTKQHSLNSRSQMSTTLEDQLTQVKSAIDEALKFVPEQVPVVLAKLSHDLCSKTASSAPSLAELLDRFAKLMTPRSSVRSSSGTADGSSVSPSGGPQTLRNFKTNHESELQTVSASQDSDVQDPKSPKALGLKSVLVGETKAQAEQQSAYTSFEDTSMLATSVGKIFDHKKKTDAQMKGKSHAQNRGRSVISSSVPRAVVHGVPILGSSPATLATPTLGSTPAPCTIPTLGSTPAPFTIPTLGSTPAPFTIPTLGSTPAPFTIPTLGSSPAPFTIPTLGSSPAPFTIPTLGSNGRSNVDSHLIFPPPTKGPMYCPHRGDNGKINGGLPKGFAPSPAYNYNPFRFNMPSVNPYGPYQEGVYSSGGSYRDLGNNYGTMSQHALHRWIECDGCGVTPIVGARYKSNVKHDYDLCSTCFSHMGNEAEYTRIDKPILGSERLRDINKDQRIQLDCRFIKDVTVPDGTLMAPSTPFTKIWRMRNSGSTIWPLGTQLTWVGGDEFACQSSVKLGVPGNGFPVDQEIDVGVDFVAPAKPGRYISYWRLASPNLQTFGQRVWVLIQVEQPVQASGTKQTAAMNLNLPAEGNTTRWKSFIDLNEPTDPLYEYHADVTHQNARMLSDYLLKKYEANKTKESEPAQSDVRSVPTAAEPVQVPITDPHTLSAEPTAMPAPEPLPKPTSVHAAVPVPTLVNSAVPAPAPISVPASPLPNGVVNMEKLLRELEEMGFRQFDLNKEILKQNDYDLLRSVDDLCGFHEWDPLLTELHELGLDATEAREVLAKDDRGSIIKRVAMNLLSREDQ